MRRRTHYSTSCGGQGCSPIKCEEWDKKIK
uniref:Uncharacterized protein n=1 Tax=Anguilla anguilla TaxID=7936 RepID=A0A0E9VG31_ANGAN